MIDVIEVHPDPLIEITHPVAATHLPQACDPWSNAELAALPRLILFPLLGTGGPRANQTHISIEHTPHLRELIEAVLAQEASERRDPGVIPHLENGAGHLVLVQKPVLELVGVDHHCAELVAAEW